MLKEMFEQFVLSGATCVSYEAGRYLYTSKSNKMLVEANIPFPYEPSTFEELVHRNMVDITHILIS